MEEFGSRHRLRTYLIATFVPLAGMPLLALAVLTYAFVNRALDQETSRRARPELEAVSRNFETLERKLSKELALLSKNDGFKVALVENDKAGLESSLSKWMLNAQFDSLQIYTANGSKSWMAAQSDRDRALEGLAALFSARKPASVDEPARKPSGYSSNFNSVKARYETSPRLKLSDAFRRFLGTEDAWAFRDLTENPRAFRLAVYRTIVDDHHRPLGYLEGLLVLDSAKLEVLSRFQGVDLVLITPERLLLSASSSDVALNLAKAFDQKRASDAALDLKTLTREILANNQPVEFFFAPLQSESAETAAWVGAGLSKVDQVEFKHKILTWIAILAAVMSAIVIYLTFVISEWITRPLTALVVATDAMRAGEWVQPVQAESKTEIGYLVRRFNDMALSVQVTKRTLETKLGELAQAHDALTQTQDQLVQSAKLSSLGQLVAGVAHELNNPIAFIYSNMSQMRTYLKNLASLAAILGEMKKELNAGSRARLDKALDEIEWDYVRKDMEEIVKSCLEGSIRVKDIVLGLRNFSRLDQGQTSEFDLHKSLKDTVKLLSSQIKNRVEVHWNLCEDGSIEGNLSQINQVLMNLIANAVQAIEGKGQVWITTTQDENAVVISVRDDGKGIPPENINRIFDPFFTTKKVGDGTGLGLSIVYGIIERHRGSIQVRSLMAPDPAHGTEFTVRLPRRGQTAQSDPASVSRAS